MDDNIDIQLKLFGVIRNQIPEHVSLVDEVADILGISNDSAYRRIRGEKPISLYEVQKLARVFNFSVDDITGSRFDTVNFKTSFLEEDEYSFSDWLGNILQLTQETSQGEQAEVMFILNELNIFHLVQFPEVCAFKLFFWQKSNLDFPEFREKRFKADELDEDILTLSKKITDGFVGLNTIEFTTEECLNSYLKQVLYYAEAGYFDSRNDALILCEKLHELVNHQQKQAEVGFKFPFGHTPMGEEGNFRLYHNDIVLADNTILIQSGDFKATYLTSNAINLIHTTNRTFFEYNYNWGMNLLSKSVPISGTAEKERNRFFRILRDQIDKVAERI